MEWKKLRRKIQVPAYIQFFISIVFWIAAGLRLYGTLPLAVYVFMGMLLVCNISIILSTFLRCASETKASAITAFILIGMAVSP